MSSLYVKLLGGFEIRDGSGAPVGPLRRQAQAVLAVLALNPGVALSRDKLAALFWSERGDSQARGGLRSVLSDLRKALADCDPPPLIADRDTARIDSNAVEVDAVTFARLIDEDTPESLERAAALYRGEFLDGLGVHDAVFEAWLRDERARLHDGARTAVSRLLEYQMAAGNSDKALATAKRLLGLDPTHEGAHRALMRIYTDTDDRALALKQYRTCCEVLRAELGIEPEVATQQLHQDIRRTPTPGTPADRHHEEGGHDPPALPDKPSIAVLPFVNMSGDAEQEYFSDGITEDIITEISRFRNLFVIARNSSFTYKGGSIEARDVGRELGVQFILEGSVRKAGKRVRVTAQLVDAGTGHHVWAEHYDRDLEDIFAVQDEITQTIVSTLVGRVEDATREHAKRKSPDSLAAYDYVLRGDEDLWFFSEGKWLDMKERIARSRQLFLKAIELDPNYARAHEGVAFTYINDWSFLLGESPEDDLNRAFEYAQKAIALDDAESRAHLVLGLAHVYRGEYELGRVHLKRAVALNPNDADNLARMGYILPLLGEHEEAIELGERALRLNPYYPAWYLNLLNTAYYAAHRYVEAIAALEGSRHSYPDDVALLAACYAHSGQLDKARALMADFLRSADSEAWWLNVPDSAAHVERDPTGLLRYATYMYPFKNSSDLDHLLDGFRKAGLPE